MQRLRARGLHRGAALVAGKDAGGEARQTMQQDQRRTQAGQARTAKAPGQAQGHQHEEHAERQVVDPGGKALGGRIDGAQPTQGVVDMAIARVGQGGQSYANN